MIRIGQAIDIHPLTENRDLIIGGVHIDHHLGLAGHSDADVLVHAIMESILGALALGDLGYHFPDTDPQYKGISSLTLMDHVTKLMKEHHFKIGNVDATILAEKPKMAPHIQAMRENIAKHLDCDISQISIKATRGEKLGFVGHEEGIVSMAVCVLESEPCES